MCTIWVPTFVLRILLRCERMIAGLIVLGHFVLSNQLPPPHNAGIFEMIKVPTCPPHSLVTSYFSLLAQHPILLSLLHPPQDTHVFLPHACHPTKITSLGETLKGGFHSGRRVVAPADYMVLVRR